MKTYTGVLKELPPNGVFCFGSNTQGRHGKGSALYAYLYFGAVYGEPKGKHGSSWAIITKDLTKNYTPSITPGEIINGIAELYLYAFEHPELDFYVAYSGIGKNLNGYTPQEMANMFSACPRPDNIIFEEEFSKLILL